LRGSLPSLHLLRDELLIHAVLCDELVVAALLGDLPSAEHDDVVGAADGRQPVRHDHRRAAADERLQRRLHELLALSVERGSGLVEEEDARVVDDGARDRDALLLPAAHLPAALSALRLVLVGEPADEAVRVRGAARLPHLLLGCVVLAVPHVLEDRDREEHWLLRDQLDLLPQPLDVQLPNVHAVDPHRPPRRVVEAQDQLHDRALPAPGTPHQRDGLPGCDVEVEVSEHGVVLARRVGERDVLQRDVALDRCWLEAVGAVDVDGGDAVDDVEHSLR